MSVAPVSEHSHATDDEDSLFGSPPPSPNRGSSSQLALPTFAGDIQNVGTIALPGSQSCIELAPNPAALLLSSFPGPPIVPASTPSSTSRDPTPTIPHPPCPSRPQSTIPVRDRSRVSRARPSQKGKERERAPTPRPPPPPIALPDPDEIPPPNFLRNQQALLGHAGLVGGVNPATIAQRHNRGSSSENPIVIDDGPPVPRPSQNVQLPSPTREDIISTLARSKSVYPVLQSIKQLLSNSGTSSMRTEDDCQDPPIKRRRLHKVPAGAVDWDVPYLFREGGATDGHRSWQKERMKQLVAQLVKLVKEATATATADAHRQKMHALGAIPPSPTPPPRDASRDDLMDVDIVGDQGRPYPPNFSPTDPSAVAAVEEMFAQIFPGSEFLPPSTSDTAPSESYTLPNVDLSSFNVVDAFPCAEPFQESQFNEFMAMLESNSIPPLSDNTDPFLASLFGTPDQTPGFAPPSSESQPQPFEDALIDPALFAPALPGGQSQPFQRDLLRLSLAPPTPALAQSPIASTSSLTGPPTPRWDGSPGPGDVDVYRPEHDEGDGFQNGGGFDMQWDGLKTSTTTSRQSSVPAPTDMQVLLPPPVARPSTRVIQPQLESTTIPLSLPPLNHNPALHPPLQQAFYPRIQPSPYHPLPPPKQSHSWLAPSQVLSSQHQHLPPPPPSSTRSAIQPRPIAPAPANPSSASASRTPPRTATKQEILRRAKERRAQLAAELERAKVELWETTIEQGVLAHLVKEASKSG